MSAAAAQASSAALCSTGIQPRRPDSAAASRLFDPLPTCLHAGWDTYLYSGGGGGTGEGQGDGDGELDSEERWAAWQEWQAQQRREGGFLAKPAGVQGGAASAVLRPAVPFVADCGDRKPVQAWLPLSLHGCSVTRIFRAAGTLACACRVSEEVAHSAWLGRCSGYSFCTAGFIEDDFSRYLRPEDHWAEQQAAAATRAAVAQAEIAAGGAGGWQPPPHQQQQQQQQAQTQTQKRQREEEEAAGRVQEALGLIGGYGSGNESEEEGGGGGGGEDEG